jgi:hypothetical protein
MASDKQGCNLVPFLDCGACEHSLAHLCPPDVKHKPYLQDSECQLHGHSQYSGSHQVLQIDDVGKGM